MAFKIYGLGCLGIFGASRELNVHVLGFFKEGFSHFVGVHEVSPPPPPHLRSWFLGPIWVCCWQHVVEGFRAH